MSRTQPPQHRRHLDHLPAMAASAAGLVTSLVADVCDMDSTAILLDGIRARVALLYDELQRSLASSPDAETVAALDKAIQAAARQLGELGTRLAAVVRSGNRTFQNAATERIQVQMLLACQLFHHQFSYALEHGMRDASQALQSCVSLPLECGRALMAIPQHISSREDADLSLAILYSQADLLLGVMSLPDNDTGAQLVPPEPLLAWLSAAASKFLALDGRLLSRGLARSARGKLSIIAFFIVCKPQCSAHAAALHLDASLQHSLVQLLLPLLHEAAVAMQLSADQRPAELSWGVVYSCVCALLSGALRVTFQMQQVVADRGDSSYVPRLLQTAAQLFARAPASRPDDIMDDSIFANIWTSLLQLLSMQCLAWSVVQEPGSTALPAESRQAMARQLLQAVPRLPIALRVAADGAQLHAEPATAAAVTLGYASAIPEGVHVLASPGPPEVADPDYSIVGGLADVPACCAAASAMLRALPYVAALETLAQLEQPLASEDAPYRPGQLAVTLMVPTSGLASAVCDYCQGMEGAWSAADATAATEALWQLHTTLCCGIHASTAGLNVVKPHIEALLTALVHCFKAALALEAALQARADSSDADGSNGKPRHLLAMSVAQAEAVLVAAAIQPPPADELLASTLLTVITSEQAALAFSPAVQQLLDDLIERLQASEASRNADSHRALLADLQHHQQQRCEPQADDALELAQAAAARSCAYLRCANLAGDGGPAAGPGTGSQRCSKCRVAWYCGTACSHADWRAGHRRMCRALRAAKVAEREGEAGLEG